MKTAVFKNNVFILYCLRAGKGNLETCELNCPIIFYAKKFPNTNHKYT